MKLHSFSRISLIISGILTCIAIFVPLWRIELQAPQYPEGLLLQMYTYKLAGQVDIINGLNHYIGMATLHADNFIEFTILPYIFAIFSLLFFFASWKNTRTWLLGMTIAFALFGAISMIDFWRWEYNYGHNLDPHAPIVVPGMSYQPPLIGFKQLLNMGAFSIPDLGGWFITFAGVLLAIAVSMEYRKPAFLWKSMAPAFLLLFFYGCGATGAVPIELNKASCDFCKMKISNARFGAELITAKGRVYVFDDIACLLGYQKQNDFPNPLLYVHDYSKTNHLIDASKAFFLHDDELKSPMGGNYAAFETEESAKNSNTKGLPILQWSNLR